MEETATAPVAALPLHFGSAEPISLDTVPMAEPVPLHWTPLGRLGFRVAVIYFVCFMFFGDNGSFLEVIPVAGGWVDHMLTLPTNWLAEWVGQHVFHLTGLAAHWHPTGSGDTTLNWILVGLFLVFAICGGLLWTLAATLRGSRRTEYQTAYAWLRFGLRLTCGFFMLNYGLVKMFPMQMAPISIAILNEPVGQSSPMTLLWSLIGMNPLYEIVCGAAEVVGGVLFLFRRTALMGSLLSTFVMANVVLYNFFFDVPVKIFAVNLLLGSAFVALADAGALFRFFWLHQPAAPSGVWVPPASRKGFRIATRTVELAFTLAFLLLMPIYDGINWHQRHKSAGVQSPLLGAWKLDAGQKATGVFVTPEGLPATDLYVDTTSRAFTRSSDGALWRTGLKLDAEKYTVGIGGVGRKAVTYAWHMPDGDHVVLKSIPPEVPKGKSAPPFTADMIALTRTPVPSHYPLLDRGFHFVNQWGLER